MSRAQRVLSFSFCVFFAVVVLFSCAGMAERHMASGKAFFNRGLFREAALEYTKAAEADFRVERKAHYEILLAYREISMNLIQKERYLEAIDELNGVRDLIGWGDVTKSTRALAYAGMGNHLADNMRYVEAVKALEKALSLDGNLSVARKGLVVAYNGLALKSLSLGRFDEGLKHLDLADAVMKTADVTRRNRAYILYRKGVWQLDERMFQKAEQTFHEAMGLDSKFSKLAKRYLATTHNNRGVALLKAGEFEKAIGEFKSALVINPRVKMGSENLAVAYCNLGLHYFDRGFFMEALAEFDRALKLEPGFKKAKEAKAVVYNNRGVKMLEAGNTDDAIHFFEKAVYLNPALRFANSNLAISHNAKGNGYSEKRDFDSAVVEFRMATKYDPDFGQAYGNLAIALGKLLQFENAWKAVEKAENLGFSVESLKRTLVEMEMRPELGLNNKGTR